MSSALQQAAENAQQNNYATLIVITAVGYDYALTYADEIEYIWQKPWRTMSTLFILVRYFGLCTVIIGNLLGTTFLAPGSDKVTFSFNEDPNVLKYYPQLGITNSSCIACLLISSWTQTVFMGAADLVMILRVWAVYKRSKFILGTLLTFYAMEVISLLVYCVLYTAHNSDVVTTLVFHYSYCGIEMSTPVLNLFVDSAEIALGAVMCLLIVIQFVKESLQMYKVSKRFSLNQYMNLLAREGTVYFLAILINAVLGLLFCVSGVHISMHGWRLMFIMIMQHIPPYAIVPRLILNLRELYARDMCSRCGSESVMDPAFGLSSNGPTSAVIFADRGQWHVRLEQEQGEIYTEADCNT